MKKFTITIISVILIIISIINISALENLQFYGTTFSEKEKDEFWKVLVDHDMVSGAYDNSKLYWKYNSNKKYYELSLTDKYGYRVTLEELAEAIYDSGDIDGYEKVKPWLLRYYPETNVVSNKSGKVVSVFGNPIYVGGEFRSGGTTRGGGAGRKHDYYTEASSTETFESWEILNNLPPEMIDELKEQGLTDEEISEYVWIIYNYTQGDTVRDSILNYENNTYYDISNDTHYNIDNYNVYYNDDRNIYHITNNEYNFYIQYNITHISYTYFEPVQKQIITSKYYYQLPDGRNSADLTADDILGLNLDFDVIKYEENAVDTITKGLYHFEGNYKDSSYYKNDITVFETPSYTFYDMGTYLDSALYLGHTPNQKFHINMEHANLSRSDDWTLSFKYYVEPTSTNVVSQLHVNFSSEGFVENGYQAGDKSYWYHSVVFGSKQLQQILTQNRGGDNYSVSNSYNDAILTGQWNEITIEKYNGLINVYVNGVLLQSHSFVESKLLNQKLGAITFHTGGSVYQYIDEVRIVSEALYMGENYIPQFTPYDTNLVLTLPDINKNNVIAVQTELDITGYRIGGVRPTYPEKGFVYFYVEDNRIKSTQIFNGYAWEQVKSRIKLHGKWLNPEDYSLSGVGDEFDAPVEVEDPTVVNQIIIKESGWSFGSLISKLLGGVVDLVLELIKLLIKLITELIDRLFTALFDFISTALNNVTTLTGEIGQVPTLINGIFNALPMEIQGFIIGSVSFIVLMAVIKILI